jgi:hypothetical protein
MLTTKSMMIPHTVSELLGKGRALKMTAHNQTVQDLFLDYFALKKKNRPIGFPEMVFRRSLLIFQEQISKTAQNTETA